MRTPEEFEREIAEVENKLRDMQPMLDAYNAGKSIFRIIVFVGSAIGVISTAWLAFGDYFARHWK